MAGPKRHRKDSEDPRDFPAYSIRETSISLNIPASTVRGWLGGKEGYGARKEAFEPLIKVADPQNCLLSFWNLAEASILRATRVDYKIPMLHVRRALDWVQREYPADHPLLNHKFSTDGKDIFLEILDQYVNVSRKGQLGLGPVLDLYLKRFHCDPTGLPKRIFPVLEEKITFQSAKPVMIDPRIASGRLAITGTRLPVTAAWNRISSGESYESLAQDLRISEEKIRQAMKYLGKAA